MENLSIEEKLSRIEPTIKEPAFLENRGLSNEVGYYIFDYEPKYELRVREEVSYLKNKINSNENSSFKIIEFDLYEIIIGILKTKGHLNKVFSFEEENGRAFTKKAIVNLLKLDSDSNLIVNYIKERISPYSVVFLTGVGKAYPILRSHNVLNALHQQLDEIPFILFFPGKYSGTDLILFNTLNGSNYYRAFPLIQ